MSAPSRPPAAAAGPLLTTCPIARRAHTLVKEGPPGEAAGAEGGGDSASLSISFIVPGHGSGRESLAPYLCTGAFHVEAWDADTCMPMGSLRATLESLLRQGKDSVETTLEAELRFDRLPGGGGGAPSGSLQLRLANVGRMAAVDGPASVSSMLMSRVRNANSSVSEGHLISGVVTSAPLNGRIRHRTKASRLTEAQIAAAVEAAAGGAKPPAVSDQELKLARLRKLTVLSAAREKENLGGAKVRRNAAAASFHCLSLVVPPPQALFQKRREETLHFALPPFPCVSTF